MRQSLGAVRLSAIMSAFDSFLLQIVEAATDSEDTLGVLLHGSYATGSCDSNSDVDLICVTRRSHPRRISHHFVNGREIGVLASSRPQITKSFLLDSGDNNNFVLYAFVRGRPVIDRNGDVAELIREANRIWEQGPPNPTPEVRERIASGRQIIIGSLNRWTARATRSPQWQEMVQLFSARLFNDCFYQYCRIHRLWSSAIWEMLTWTDPRYEEILTITRKYLSDPSLESRLQAIRQLAEATIVACEDNPEPVPASRMTA
jgi:predicted nucleotidyltransferase